MASEQNRDKRQRRKREKRVDEEINKKIEKGEWSGRDG
jgi:hypothetical protein